MSQSKLPSSLKTHSVLPDNRSPLERALELALAEALYAPEPLFPQLLEPNQAPPSALPFLAQEKQLPVWDSTEPEAIKQALIANAWPVRQLSGTRAGLKRALSSLDFLCQITPWHQQTPRGSPYWLDIVAWQRGNLPIKPNKLATLLAYLEQVQSERDQIELSLVFGVETSFGLCGARAPATNVTARTSHASLWPMATAEFSCAVAAAIPPAVNIQPLNLLAQAPVIAGYAQLQLFSSAHRSVTVSSINARAATT